MTHLIFRNGKPSHDGNNLSDDFKLTTRNPCFSISPLLALIASIKTIPIGTKSSGISDHLRYIYSIYRWSGILRDILRVYTQLPHTRRLQNTVHQTQVFTERAKIVNDYLHSLRQCWWLQIKDQCEQKQVCDVTLKVLPNLMWILKK